MTLTRRTRTLLSWLPAAVLVVVIGAVVVGAFVMQGSWWVQPDRAPSADQQASDGGSLLSDAGLDYVTVDGVLRVRVGEGGLSATELGLAADGDRAADLRRPVRAVIATGDEVRTLVGVESVEAVSVGDRLQQLTLTPAAASDWLSAKGVLAQLAPEWGWDAASLDALDAGLAEFTRGNTEGAFVAETPAAPAGGGVDVIGRLIFDRASGATAVQLIFAVQ